MTTKKPRKVVTPSPKQQAVRDWRRRLFATGCSSHLIKELKALGFHGEAMTVAGAQALLRSEATRIYEEERLRLDPNFETASMRNARMLKEEGKCAQPDCPICKDW